MSIDYPFTIKEYLGHAVRYVVRHAIFAQNLDRLFYDHVIDRHDYYAAINMVKAKVGRNGYLWQYTINLADQAIDAAFLEVVHTDVAAWFLAIKNGQQPATTLTIVELAEGRYCHEA